MSKALAEAKPSTKHFTFDDDEELDADASAVASGSTEAITEAKVSDTPSEEEEGDDDEPIEVVSTKASRKQASQESAKQKAQAKV